MRRREFLKATGLAVGAAVAGRRALAAEAAGASERPNVLWLSTEDISPDLGCYGDAYAVTPHLDRFASEGTRFDLCFAHMGVCAPARSGIITAMFPTTIGTNHMRCRGVPPPAVRCFTEYLRAAGYYCSNHSKTDYQFGPPFTAWTQQGGSRWWRGRAKGQPFFTVINYTGTHESRARSKPSDKLAHDPAKATLPPYYPDTPAVRRDWAKYYDNITRMDQWFADALRQLDADGLADDTIVWFWGDHGRGLPRGKRWIYDSGSRVPLLIRVPAKWRKLVCPDQPDACKPGTVNGDLALFIDFGPTVLSLCGVSVPGHMQGRPFLGPQKAEPRQYIYGARDRVDEAYDTIRCVRDKRFKYIRNFAPHLPRSLSVSYMDQMPTMQEMRRLAAEGKLRGPQLQYFECPKPIDELYDTVADPHEVHNLAADPKYREPLERLRAELFRWMEAAGDFGLLPECEFDALKWPAGQSQKTATPGVRPVQDGRAVELTCATPGASIAYQMSGGGGGAKTEGDGIVLHATKAKLGGEKPWPKKEAANLSAWRNSKAWVSWDVQIPKAGKLPLHVVWGCGGRENSKYTVEIAGQTLEGLASNTGGWDTFKAATLGEVEIPKPGTYTLTLKPVPKAGGFQMDLQAVVLGGKPAGPLAAPAASGWQVCGGPVPLAPGQTIVVKACRIGYKDSGTVRYRHGGEAVAPEEAEAHPHWRAVVDKSGVVPRALALKRLDGQGQAALAAYGKALDDPAGPVRYWAALGIYKGHDRNPVRPRTRDEAAPWLARFRRMLGDESTAARVVAAQALTDWGEGETALPVLIEALEKAPQSSGRLLAATALDRLGEKARPALPAVQKAAKQGGYVNRMCGHILRRLGGR